MVFSSITFLYYFLPIVCILYFIAPKNTKNMVLLFGSLIFYAWGEPKYISVMILSIVSGYVFGRFIEAFHGQKRATYLFVTAVALQVGILLFFKYAGIAALPVGISFYTFQILSYIMDVYHGKVTAQKHISKLALYLSMFPQLIAGPIVRYAEIETQLDTRTHSFDNFALGMRRFIIGLSKKVLLANTLGDLCGIFKVSEDKSILFFWLYGISFTLQIYFDFSGYSDMAIGLGTIFGFHFPENFNYPYIAKSITEFWRRWHISLEQWFRDYVYIPLGGNRCSKGRWLLNIFIVWLLTGAWHGGTWNFVIWGLYFALFLVLEKRFRLSGHIYVMLVVIIGFVIFNATSLTEAFSYVGGMFGLGEYPLLSKEFIYYFKSYLLVLLTAIIGATPMVSSGINAIRQNSIGKKILNLLEPVFLLLLLLLVTGYLVDSSFHPFLYFRF